MSIEENCIQQAIAFEIADIETTRAGLCDAGIALDIALEEIEKEIRKAGG